MVFELGRIERPGQTCLFIIVAGPLPEPRPPYSSRAVAANQAARGILSHDVIDHQILHCDDVTLEAQNLADMGDPARPVAKPCGLDDDIDGRYDHFPDGPARESETAHGNHGQDGRALRAASWRATCP